MNERREEGGVFSSTSYSQRSNPQPERGIYTTSYNICHIKSATVSRVPVPENRTLTKTLVYCPRMSPISCPLGWDGLDLPLRDQRSKTADGYDDSCNLTPFPVARRRLGIDGCETLLREMGAFRSCFGTSTWKKAPGDEEMVSAVTRRRGGMETHPRKGIPRTLRLTMFDTVRI